MRAFLDTNAYTAFAGGDGRMAEALDACDAILLSPIVIGELIDGFLGGNREWQNRDRLEKFRGKSSTVSVPITDATAEWFAHIKKQLREKGKPIPLNDIWIAASCMEHGAALISLDSHFLWIEGLLIRPLP